MSNELKVGLSVIVAALLLYAGVRFLQGSPLFGAGPEVVGIFEDAEGLQPGAPVRMSGVQIGRVAGVALADDGRRVFVHLAVDPGVDVPRGSRANIGGIAALGDVYVEFVPPVGATAGRPLADGDTILAAPSSDVLAAVQRNAAPLIARADSLFATVLGTYRAAEPTLVDGANDLAAAAAQARFITTALGRSFIDAQGRGDFERLGGTFERLDRAAAAAERAALNIEGLTAEYRTSLGGRGTVFADSLTAAMGQLSTALRRFDRSLEGLDQTAALLDTTLLRVNSTEGSLGLLLNDPSLYYNATGAAASLQQLMDDLRQNPSRYTRGVVRVF
jgi:phospholipid/cholesterol/gamma-HCH transport system substrate-binding protein